MTGWFQVYHSSANRQRGNASTDPLPENAEGTEHTQQGNTASSPTDVSAGSSVQQVGDNKADQSTGNGNSEQGDTKQQKNSDDKSPPLRKKRSYEDEWQSTLYWP